MRFACKLTLLQWVDEDEQDEAPEDDLGGMGKYI
jgi:hypothetical protein